MKRAKHFCQDHRESINSTESVCKKCGNRWIMGKGWLEKTPSFREWSKYSKYGVPLSKEMKNESESL